MVSKRFREAKKKHTESINIEQNDSFASFSLSLSEDDHSMQPCSPSQEENSKYNAAKRKRFFYSNHLRLRKKTFFCLIIVLATLYKTTYEYLLKEATRGAIRGKLVSKRTKAEKIQLSIVILTYQKHDLLKKLLPTVINQKGINFEIVIVDNGCVPDTKQVIDEAFSKDLTARSIPHKYLPLCDNPGYAIGNNKGVEITSKQAEWLILLNDDIVLQGEHFFKDMIDLGEMKPKAGGVVCKLLTAGGEEVIEAGSIVWKDGTATGIGRGTTHVGASDLSYAKPVDYGSGACLMMRKKTFVEYDGFDYKHFPNYFEDTDIQLHIQHDLGLEVWLQPRSIALHEEHGSFSSSKATELMKNAALVFEEMWRTPLQHKHLPNPYNLPEHEKKIAFMKASDLRARDINKANILWLEQSAPNKANGSGFGRAFDNLSVVAELGHRVTVVLMETLSASWCNKRCRDEITGLGVELHDGNWEKYVEDYIDFFDIVVVSRPSVFQQTYEKWQKFYKKHSFRLIYDCEALWYKRDKMLLSLIKDEGIEFPGGLKEFGITPKSDSESVDLTINHAEQMELSMLSMADTVLAVSQNEAQIVSEVTSNPQSYTVGHIMNIQESSVTEKTFQQRDGILFLGSFMDSMYYNGDAIWYFLTKIYHLVARDAGYPIPLTIAGKQIPSKLRDLVKEDSLLAENVIFRESVVDIHELYNNARIFIAPHMYGAGIQYKVRSIYSLLLLLSLGSFSLPHCIYGLTYHLYLIH